MATTKRKFKNRVAQRKNRVKAGPVFSVELLRKETLEKLGGVWKKLISKFKSLKLAN